MAQSLQSKLYNSCLTVISEQITFVLSGRQAPVYVVQRHTRERKKASVFGIAGILENSSG